MTTGRILNIPNILTLARIALIPVFLLVAYWPPVMGIAEQAVSMSRHILLTSIFCRCSGDRLVRWLFGADFKSDLCIWAFLRPCCG